MQNVKKHVGAEETGKTLTNGSQKNTAKSPDRGKTLPPPGKCLTFEEATTVAFRQHDKALRELAK